MTNHPDRRTRVRATHADLAISVPATWRRSSDPDCGVLVVARPTSVPASGVRPGLTLRCEPVVDGAVGWRSERIAHLGDRTERFALEDEDAFELNGHDVSYLRYAHLVRGTDLLCDEWAWLADKVGFVLTGTVARVDYPDFCDVFEAVAHTFEPLASSRSMNFG